jgi:hypothetical protein
MDLRLPMALLSFYSLKLNSYGNSCQMYGKAQGKYAGAHFILDVIVN